MHYCLGNEGLGRVRMLEFEDYSSGHLVVYIEGKEKTFKAKLLLHQEFKR